MEMWGIIHAVYYMVMVTSDFFFEICLISLLFFFDILVIALIIIMMHAVRSDQAINQPY